MRSDTLIADTLIMTTAGNSTVQCPTVPACVSADREHDAANLWAEKMFALAKPASKDAERFAAGFMLI